MSETLVTLLNSLGGYIHPLFTDVGHAHGSGFAACPLAGQGLLLLMGGLAEQSGLFDQSVIALLGFGDVSFQRPVVPGQTIALQVELLTARRTSRPERGIVTARWRAVGADGETFCEATAHLLVHTPPQHRLSVSDQASDRSHRQAPGPRKPPSQSAAGPDRACTSCGLPPPSQAAALPDRLQELRIRHATGPPLASAASACGMRLAP